MCGIVGYTGPRPVLPLLIGGLRKLEYRGYDSAGVALQTGVELVVAKAVGRLSCLEERVAGIPGDGFLAGMGHTRWATHGRPSDINAHPHGDCRGRFAVAHNGIIENYRSLRERLRGSGHHFSSETDTEVIPHLIEEAYRGDLASAVRSVAGLLRGSFALVAMAASEPGLLVAVRKDSPLIVGLGDGENFLASDIPAILEYTKSCYILDDGELVVADQRCVEVQDLTGRVRHKPVFQVPWDVAVAERGGYPHFMLKEIHEQPQAVRETLRDRIKEGELALDEFGLDGDAARALRRLHLVGCGTAYHACLVGKYLIEKLARLAVEVDLASEFRYRDPMVETGSLLVAVSQSGETADTLAALREGKRQGARTVAISNVMGSSITREAGSVFYTRAGLEQAVASTKAYVTQLVALMLLAVDLGAKRGTVPEAERAELIEAIQKLPELAEEVLKLAPAIDNLARQVAQWEDAFFIGRGLDYAVALEGQLKLKEISYIHAEAYAAGELKHGTLALIVERIPVIALATQPPVLDKMISNITEVRARGGRIIAVCSNEEELAPYADDLILLPACHPLLMPVLAVMPLQLLAYYAAVHLGCDVDKPRNLAKSVTVE
ncbi:MAG TPA: glutamine--fructose-6-phosphate transaminase (isomerizing) [Clostridiales bacterium UBA8153]|nr:glutamine--fructose-6-phosphate transaminase (isomerizing) [Clostridiales bacterium UBA8153]